MTRAIFIYGLISGTLAVLGIIGTILLPAGNPLHESLWVGYLIMLVALSAILVGVKQYRDDVQGGVISFGKAFLIGLGIAAVAGVAYVLVWEAYCALAHYDFADGYIRETLAAQRAAGVTGAAYQKAVADMETFRAQYANPLYRMPMTFAEIFPVGLLIALVSAALLRNPRFLPAKATV